MSNNIFPILKKCFWYNVLYNKYLMALFLNIVHFLKLKRCFNIVCLFFSFFPAFANVPNHYIVAFDQSIGRYRSYYVSVNILNAIDCVLTENGFDKKKDFLSMVAYTMEMGNPSIDRFVRPYYSDNEAVIWKSLEGNSIVELFPNWPEGQPLLNVSSYPFGSMQSLAKPFIVMETKKEHLSTMRIADAPIFVDTRYRAGKTFLLLLSDEVVNGTDDNYAQEWNNVSTSIGANTREFKHISRSVFNTMRGFNEEFKFIQIEFKKEGRRQYRIPISDDGGYNMIPYEVVSVERPSIYAISDMPSPLPIKRVRGGFRLKIDVCSLFPKYEIVDIKILGKGNSVLGVSNGGQMDIFIPSSKITVGDSLSLAMSLTLNDGFYNGAIISPENSRYQDGMIVKQIVKVQDEAKVLGVLYLSDIFWWWFPNDIFSAVMVWDLIILLILIIIIGYILYRCFVRINTYKPSNDKLKITKI